MSAARRRTARGTRVRKIGYRMRGGPLNDTVLFLSCPGTLPMRDGAQIGFYNQHNVWEIIHHGKS